MASGRKFQWKHAGAAIGGGLAGAGVLLGLGKLGAPPVITASLIGGMGLVGVGVTRGPVQTAIGSSIGSSTVVLLGSALVKGRERSEAKERKEKPAERAPAVAGDGKAPVKPRGASRIELATVEAFDRARAGLEIDDEERAAA
jgi:hypothetical protein